MALTAVETTDLPHRMANHLHPSDLFACPGRICCSSASRLQKNKSAPAPIGHTAKPTRRSNCVGTLSACLALSSCSVCADPYWQLCPPQERYGMHRKRETKPYADCYTWRGSIPVAGCSSPQQLYPKVKFCHVTLTVLFSEAT